MADSSLSNLTSILSGLTGKGKTTTTTSNNVSAETMNALVEQQLKSIQGLSSIARGERSSGLYNSSTNELLVNDLLTSAAAKAAAASSSSTTTVAQSGGASKLVGALGLGSLAYDKLWGQSSEAAIAEQLKKNLSRLASEDIISYSDDMLSRTADVFDISEIGTGADNIAFSPLEAVGSFGSDVTSSIFDTISGWFS